MLLRASLSTRVPSFTIRTDPARPAFGWADELTRLVPVTWPAREAERESGARIHQSGRFTTSGNALADPRNEAAYTRRLAAVGVAVRRCQMRLFDHPHVQVDREREHREATTPTALGISTATPATYRSIAL
jgi:hypothetical protein